MIPQYTKTKSKQDKLNITTGTEFETGRIIDGKKEYAKRVDCGFLTAGSTSTAYNVSNINAVTKIDAMFYNINSKSTYAIPRAYILEPEKYNVDCNISVPNGTIILESGSNYNGTTFKAVVTIYYTKN